MNRSAVALLSALVVGQLFSGPAAAAPPFADVHVHYKWTQAEITSPEDAVRILRDSDVGLAVVIGMPADHALKLQALAPELVRPIWSPYQKPGDWSEWAFRKSVIASARKALESGRYHGIGELHLIGGFTPKPDSPVIAGLMQLAAEYGVPVMVHTEISRVSYMRELCRAHPRTQIIWAHAGAILTPADVAAVMRDCPHVWAELAARDPWRFVRNPIVDEQQRLLPAWEALIRQYADRILVGTDPVWPVDRMDSWAEPDSGWQQYPRFIGFHRDWLSTLPADIAGKIRWRNAQELFRRQ